MNIYHGYIYRNILHYLTGTLQAKILASISLKQSENKQDLQIANFQLIKTSKIFEHTNLKKDLQQKNLIQLFVFAFCTASKNEAPNKKRGVYAFADKNNEGSRGYVERAP